MKSKLIISIWKPAPTPPGGGRAYRATIYIQDPALDARSLKLAMQTRGGGAVVNIGSGTKHTAEKGLSWYLAAKQGIAAFTALQRQGIDSQFLYFPDENHWILKPDNRVRWYNEVFQWLDKYTKP